eukprot:11110880-Ditylum_brightwellii.AAC.1
MMIHNCFKSSTTTESPPEYFDLLIHTLFNPKESYSDNLSLSSTTNPATLAIFCSSVNFISIHKINFLFASQVLPSKTKKDIQQEWYHLWSFVGYNNHISDPLLPVEFIFFSQLNPKQTPIVIDCGASKSLSPFCSYFISFTPQRYTINGICATSHMEGEGIVQWKVVDQNGKEQTIESHAFYVPSASIW